MNTELIAKTWATLRVPHGTLIQGFYVRFFERHPHYRPLFPAQMDHHMRRMVDTMAMVSRLAGERHRGYGLAREDLDNFRDVFIEVIEENCQAEWDAECRAAWKEAFDRAVLPLVMRGLGTQSASSSAGGPQ